MEVWLASRMESAGVEVLDDGEPLFLGARRGGHLTDRPMSAQAVRLVLVRRVEEAGVGAATPHDMRRSFVSAHLDAGTGVELVQQLVGHSSPVTTARYDRRPASARDRAADNIVVPWVSPAS
ncbi:MAG: tyrosine-type recombinase/integrase [Actinomycetota bacterium]|nr:tyrosine-type recombinase/integrase [Actinomycetota bacterium]